MKIVDEKLIKIETNNEKVEEERIENVKVQKEQSENEKVKAENIEIEEVEEAEEVELKYCISGHYVDKEDFVEFEGRCKGSSVDRTLMSSGSSLNCPIGGAEYSVDRLSGTCISCDSKVIPAVVGLENDGTMIYDDCTRGKEDFGF